MKTIIKNYLVSIIATFLAVPVVVYDFNYYWPNSLDWLEGCGWFAIVLLAVFIASNILFFRLNEDNKERFFRRYIRKLNNLSRKTKIVLIVFLAILFLIITFLLFFIKEKPDSTSLLGSSFHQAAKDTPSVPSRAIPGGAEFVEKEISIFEPDLVILTKSLGDLPKDFVQRSLLSKIVTKETMFYYEDDPSFLGFLGMLKRLSYEHNTDFKDDIVKYVMSMSAEVALWRGGDGRIKDFLFIADEKSINKNILSFSLKIKQILGDKKIETFSHSKENGYYLSFGKQKIAVWNSENKLYITNLSHSYFPENSEIKLNEIVAKKYGEIKTKGFYKRLYNTQLDGKHSIILSSKFLSFGYNYFFPALEALRLDFNNDTWHPSLQIGNGGVQKDFSTEDLWKAYPQASAFCVAIPVNAGRIANILEKYKTLTKKRVEDEKNTAAADKAKNEPTDEFEKALFDDKEIEEFLNHPIGVCWYEKSTILTPVFIVKIKGADKKRDKIKSLFNKFVGALEVGDKYISEKETIRGQNTILSKLVSSRYGISETTPEDKKELVFKKKFEVKLAFNSEYLVFSPDGALVDLSLSTIEKKNPSIYDELKVNNKNLGLIFNPYRTSRLLDKYLKEALPSQTESTFRKAVEEHLSSSFNNLSALHPFGIEMPGPNGNNISRWEELKIYDL